MSPRGYGGYHGHGGHGGFRGGWGGYGPGHCGYRDGRGINHGHRVNVIPARYTGGNVRSGSKEVEFVDKDGNKISYGQYLRKEFGTIKGTIMGLRLSTTASWREETFISRCRTADELLAEHRITDRECKSRKMIAAKKWYGYLHKIGYLDEQEYQKEMDEYAQSIGIKGKVSFETGGRSR